MTLLDRFCRYVQIDTQANEASTTYPSTPGQLDLGRLLTQELQAMGARDAVQDDHGIVLATLPATQATACPVIAWIAHVDTSPETSGHGVKPIVHRNYDGKDIVLPGDPSKVLRAADNPDLAALVGKTIVTTDGTTLLGADDKAGIAVIMQAAAHLLALQHLERGGASGAFNLGNGHGVSVRELIASVERVTGLAVARHAGPRRPGDPAVLVAASARIIRELGWQPRLALLDDMVTTAWAWHRAHPHGYRSAGQD